jgi:fructose-bisphosphate aldolase class II/tagatose 1,6-diphosphate aldolase GatY/KbaY
VKLIEKLKEVSDNKKALLAANFYNLETCTGIVRAAGKLKCPIILQLTPGSIKYMGLKTAVAIARTVSAQENIQSWIHLDHCTDNELIKLCLDEGFDSIMIDASDKDLAENIFLTSGAVKIAEPYNVNVEAELGYVPKPDNEVDLNKFTEPLEVKRFVEETGVTSLAIAVGSKHGFYRGKPQLDIQRIAEIRKISNTFLVLHGASGLPAETLKYAVANGISKVNIATETKYLFMKSLKEILQKSDDIDLRNVFPSAINKINNMIQRKIEIVSMADQSQ